MHQESDVRRHHDRIFPCYSSIQVHIQTYASYEQICLPVVLGGGEGCTHRFQMFQLVQTTCFEHDKKIRKELQLTTISVVEIVTGTVIGRHTQV
jgi:hypothetical protein